MGKKKQKHYDPFVVARFEPLTANQEKAFKCRKNMVLSGSAGTGKTFMASYFAAKELINKSKEQIIIVRSAVPTRDMGFLPGNDKEKSRIYEEPYFDIFSEIFSRGDAYEILKKKEQLYFLTTSYMRGITLEDSYIIVDECQNMTLHELDSVVTRLGNNCKIVFCGDFKQADLRKNGMGEFMKICDSLDKDFEEIVFKPEDIVRSDFVKRYITAKEKLGL